MPAFTGHTTALESIERSCPQPRYAPSPVPKSSGLIFTCPARAGCRGSQEFISCRRTNRRSGLDPERILCGNGSDEILALLAHVFLRPGDEGLYSEHGFLEYPISIRAA